MVRGVYICIENSGEMMPNASNAAVVLGLDEALTVSKQVAAMSRKENQNSGLATVPRRRKEAVV